MSEEHLMDFGNLITVLFIIFFHLYDLPLQQVSQGLTQ